MSGRKAALAVALLAAACARRAGEGPRRTVILRFENLSGEARFDWVRRGVSRQIAGELEQSGRLSVVAADSAAVGGEREAALAIGARGVLQGYLAAAGGRLRLRAEIEDAETHRVLETHQAEGAIRDGIIPLAHSIALGFDSQAHPFGARIEEALALYAAALDEPDPRAARDDLARAVVLDPDFGAAYVAAVRLAESQQDRTTAERVLAQAHARGSMSEANRLRLDAEAAILAGDAAAETRALTALSRLAPSDQNVLRLAGDLELAARHYAQSAGFYRRAAALEPFDAALLNLLGYVQGYAGDYQDALDSLHAYAFVRPQEANPLDSQGEISLYLGHYPEAEKLFRAAYSKDSTFLNGATLLKAAVAHLMTGDVRGADAIFAEFVKARREGKDPLADYREAEWDYWAGRGQAALEKMEKLASRLEPAPWRELASFAHTEAALWLLDRGERTRAREQAERALKMAASPSSSAMAAIAGFLTAPEAPAAEWVRRAGTVFPGAAQDRLRQVGLAYALLFSRHFSEAVPQVRKLEQGTAPNVADAVPVLLAWALAGDGHPEDAAKWLERTPVLAFATLSPFDSLVYPKLVALRAAVKARAGAPSRSRL